MIDERRAYQMGPFCELEEFCVRILRITCSTLSHGRVKQSQFGGLMRRVE